MEHLIQQPASSYTPPTSPLPTDFTHLQQEQLQKSVALPFGASTKEHLYFVDPDWTFINHGAFGGALSLGFDQAAEWRKYAEVQPLRYFDRDLLPHLAHSVRMLADFINADPEDVVLLPNATSGLNIVLRGAIAQLDSTNDRVVLYDTAYGSVKKIVTEQCVLHNVALDIVPFPLPLPSAPEKATQLILQSLESAIDSRTKLVILDQTTSQTAINMPIVEMTRKAKELGVKRVVVDGAHGLLARNLDM